MKPQNIVLIRHGQSEGNVNKKIYNERPDYALRLTDIGISQARAAGENLRGMFGQDVPQFYISPFWRTRETFREIRKAWETYDIFTNFYEDSRLREQEWHGKLPLDGFNDDAETERDAYGHFYYRFEGGESCADVEDRVSSFMNTLHRDFEKPNFPRNCVIVTHGMTMRVFLKRWFHLSVESFEELANPKNCEIVLLSLNDVNKYELQSSLRKHRIKHEYQFKWGC